MSKPEKNNSTEAIATALANTPGLLSLDLSGVPAPPSSYSPMTGVPTIHLPPQVLEIFGCDDQDNDRRQYLNPGR